VDVVEEGARGVSRRWILAWGDPPENAVFYMSFLTHRYHDWIMFITEYQLETVLC
jgi:hypothetical protein